MYSSFFGFTEKPFDVTPDPKFLYLNPGRREPLAAMLYGIKYRRGFIAIIGEVGTGKTTLINTVLEKLDEKTDVANIFNTDLPFDQLLTMILAELGLGRASKSVSKVEAIDRLNKFAIGQLAKGANVVLVIDEAQNLDYRSLENLRLLSNLETRKQKLIQIILSGQPELDAKLNRPELRQLNQRISLKRYIVPFSEQETYEYIEHRLKIANYKSGSLFTRGAKKLVWKYSEGIPRKINVLCDNTLLIGYALQKKKIKEEIVKEAVKDLSWSPFSKDAPVEGEHDAPVELEQRKKKTAEKRSGFVFRSGFAILAGLAVGLGLLLLFFQYVSPSWLERFKVEGDVKRQEASAAIVRKPIRQSTSPNSKPPNAIEETETADDDPVPVTGTEDMNVERDDGSKPNPAGSESRGDVSMKAETSPEIRLDRVNSFVPLSVFFSGAATPETRPSRVIIVKKGDCLSQIITDAYGGYDKEKLEFFMRENPQIQNPNLLQVGQALILPAMPDRN